VGFVIKVESIKWQCSKSSAAFIAIFSIAIIIIIIILGLPGKQPNKHTDIKYMRK